MNAEQIEQAHETLTDMLQRAEDALMVAAPVVKAARDLQDLLDEHAPWTTGSLRHRVGQLIALAAPRPDPGAPCTPQNTVCRRCLNDLSKCDKTWDKPEGNILHTSGYLQTEATLRWPIRLKDHEIAQTVNTLRDIALEFRDAEQLRERIAQVVVPLLAAKSA